MAASNTNEAIAVAIGRSGLSDTGTTTDVTTRLHLMNSIINDAEMEAELRSPPYCERYISACCTSRLTVKAALATLGFGFLLSCALLHAVKDAEIQLQRTIFHAECDTFGRAVEWQLLQPTPLHAAFNAYMTTHQWSTTKANISLYLGLLNAQQGAGLMSLSFSRLVKGNRTERIPFQMATASPCTRLSLSLEFASSDDSGTELNGLTETEYMTAILGGVSLSKRTDASYIAIHTPMYRNHTAIIMATDQKAVRLSECFGIMNTHFDGAALLTRSVSLLTAMDTEVTLLQTNGLLAKGSVISVRSSSREVSYGERYSKSFNFSEQFYAVQCTPVIERIGISYVPITVSACVMVFFIIMSTTLWSTIIVRHRLLRRTSVLKGVMDARARAIQLLIAARKDAENANQSKSSFVSYLCHELRNPLHAIIAMLEFFREPDAPDYQVSLETITSSASMMETLLTDVLDISKIEAGKMQFESIPFDIRRIFAQTIRTLQLSANQKGLTISSTLESDVPAGLIGDPNRLQQLLVNLLTNGLKFTKTGGLKIHVAVKATENAKQKGAFASRKDFEHTTSTACKPSIGYQTVDLEIVVQDSGIGMTESELHRLFDPFVQSNASIAREYGGTGLGLSIVRGIVELLGGKVVVESKVGIGTKFSVTLNFRIATADQLSAAVLPRKRSFSASPPYFPVERLHDTALDEDETAGDQKQNMKSAVAMTVMLQSPAAISVLDRLPSFRLPAPAGKPHSPSCDTGSPSPVHKRITEIKSSLRTSPFDMKLLESPDPHPRDLGAVLPTVLVVDDSEVNRRIITRMLKDRYLVQSAANGAECLEIVLHVLAEEQRSPSFSSASPACKSAAAAIPIFAKPFVILMDFEMPVMDGITASRRLRELKISIPVVGITGNTVTMNGEQLSEIGICALLCKPFRRNNVLSVLENIHRVQMNSSSPGGVGASGEKIIAAKVLNKKMYCLVRWREYPTRSDTWELSTDIETTGAYKGFMAES